MEHEGSQEEGVSSKLPKIIALLTHNFDAWIVGSAANPVEANPRDWDILVPYHKWHAAVSLVPTDAKPNTFGGWKFNVEGVEVDMWPGDLSWLASHPLFRYAWHPLSNARIMRI